MQRPLSLSLTAAMALSAVGLAGCKPKQSAAQDPLTLPRLVQPAVVESSSTMDGRFTGVVGARVESELGFRIAGKVVDRLVDTGQAVHKGEVLMRIDPTDYVHALDAQAGNVAAARAHWIQAATDERRNRGLVATGAISQSAYDQVKAASDSAKALLDAAISQEQVARNQQAYSDLLADADGTVMETRAEPGQVVAAGQLVIRLAHNGPREAVVDLPETTRPIIGSPAKASLYGDKLQVTARLRQLSDAADPRTRTFEARYVMDGDGATAPLGATVTLDLANAKTDAELTVPLGAIDDEGKGPGVWVIDTKSTRVFYHPIQIISFGEETVNIRGGVAPGEAVVATGGHYLHEGEQVRLASNQAAMQ